MMGGRDSTVRLASKITGYTSERWMMGTNLRSFRSLSAQCCTQQHTSEITAGTQHLIATSYLISTLEVPIGNVIVDQNTNSAALAHYWSIRLTLPA